MVNMGCGMWDASEGWVASTPLSTSETQRVRLWQMESATNGLVTFGGLWGSRRSGQGGPAGSEVDFVGISNKLGLRHRVLHGWYVGGGYFSFQSIIYLP